jgi:hypothetical protein
MRLRALITKQVVAVPPSGAAHRSTVGTNGGEFVSPGGELVAAVNTRLGNEVFRENVRALHAQGASLLEMVEQLGLAPLMSAAVRNAVENLPPETVTAIRRATLEMLDRAETQMPLDCDIEQSEIDSGTPVDVNVVDDAGASVITVRARRSPR